jgi:hypothetical protein
MGRAPRLPKTGMVNTRLCRKVYSNFTLAASIPPAPAGTRLRDAARDVACPAVDGQPHADRVPPAV